MKADEPLDYALFQLDSTRTRCELWISAGGVTEKLASGLLKPFLDHLRAAQEQISSGAQSIRLQAPSVTANGRNSGAAWFSKGTMERFVRFVSIPEVLERVSAVEAECQRLDEAINILANDTGDDYHLFDSTSGPLSPGVKAVDGKGAAAKAGEMRKLKPDYHDTKEATGDTSKRQLLRAMDGRRAMLQKEQKKALAQAVAAGFNMEYMPSLVVFADCFGALQLREACTKFMALRKKIQEFGSLVDEMELAAETVITVLKMNRSGIILLDSESSGASSEISSHNGGHLDDTHEKSVISSSDNQDNDKVGGSRVKLIKQKIAASKVGSSTVPDAFKPQLVMPQAHLNSGMKVSADKWEYGSNHLEHSERMKMGTKVDFLDGENLKGLNAKNNFISSGVPAVPAMLSSAEIERTDYSCDSYFLLKQDQEPKYSVDNHTGHSEGRSPSPEKRSLSPIRKVQIGRPPVRRQGVVVMKNFPHPLSKSMGSSDTKHRDDDHSESSESEEESGSKVDRDEEKQDQKIEHKRLSVQAAISLFESKKKESSEVPSHKAKGVDSQKEASETGNRSAPVKDVLKRWNVTSDSGPGFATTSLKAKDVRENTERDLSSRSKNNDNEDAERKHQAMDSEKTRDMHSMKADIHGLGLPAVHDVDKSHAVDLERKDKVHSVKAPFSHAVDFERDEKLHPVKATFNSHEWPAESEEQKQVSSKTTTQFDSATLNQQFLQSSKQHGISGPPDYTKPNIRRWSLTTSPFRSTIDEHVRPDSHNAIPGKVSISDQGRVFSEAVVRGVAPAETVTHSEQKPKNSLPAKLGANASSVLQKADSVVEDVGQNKDPLSGWRGTNLLKRPNQQDMRDISKSAGHQTEQRPIVSAPHDPMEKSATKGTVRRSWSTPSDFHLEALAKMVDSKDNEEEDHESVVGAGNPKDLSAMFYEQYRQKRDAKLRQESNLKRAEREAKMKAMQEAFERSKEELTARNNKSSDHSNVILENAGYMGKIQSSKAGPSKTKRESVTIPSSQESQYAAARASKGLSSRQASSRKVSPSAQKTSSVTAVHNSIRATSSPLQKPNPRNSPATSGARSSQRRGSSGSPVKMAENILKSSSPSPVELRKEPTKAYLGSPVDILQLEKRTSLQGFPCKDAGHALNLLGMALPDSLVQASESMRESQKSIFMLDELQQDEKFPASELSAEDRQDEPDCEEVKTFYNRSTESKPGSEPDKPTMKSSFIHDAVNTRYEEDFSSSSSNIAPFESEEPESVSTGDYEETSYCAEQLSAPVQDVHPLGVATEEASSSYFVDKDISLSGHNGSNELQQQASSTGQMSRKLCVSLDDQDSHLEAPACSFEGSTKPPLPTLFSLHSKERFQNSRMDSNDAGLTQSFMSPPKNMQLPTILNAGEMESSAPIFSASPLALKFAGDSNYPTVNPIKFDQPQSRKMWSDSQKALSLNSQHLQKESSKGFKRLLKFGRKSRGSETSTHDWVVASTSEGDEDGDESRDCFGEDDSRNAYKHAERVSKSTDLDGVIGAGPRSFFSLSSFRSKSSESRSRA